MLKRFFIFLEWVLVIFLGGQALLYILLSVSVLFSHSDEIRQAKKDGTYYSAPAVTQSYFNRTLTVDGVAYDGKELRIYMTGRHFGSGSILPSDFRVTTDTGEEFSIHGGHVSSSAYFAKGMYHMESVPANLHSIRVHQEQYGEAFSFTIPLGEGGKP
ncbi:hypothetical protein NDK47_18030 [Brevibacillus ruminantium]|uniref:Uncharacterized protein n=1 Tax=Brevibacillus ruminantium TaxID=2950604 RepID=A0ABY4WA33_9BACL|nr:hypothetical protein [Brevibacillus ruminantium]USG64047.1 hypothetical protein NDK47_18030 [Brevibacillus ruminantium]